VSSFRISGRSGRPPSLMVRLSSKSAHNRWIDCKRTKDVLDSSEVSMRLGDSRIEVNENFYLLDFRSRKHGVWKGRRPTP